MNKKFNIGDRVKGTEYAGRLSGKQGRVIGFSGNDVTVEFDEYINGHDGSLCGTTGKDGHCWHCLPHEVKPAKQNRVIFNDKATVLIKDGKKYVSKCKDGDTYDKEKGLLLCLAQANGISYRDLQEMIAGAKDCNAEKVKEIAGKLAKAATAAAKAFTTAWNGGENADDKAQVREVKREAKKGEYIKIVNPKTSFGDYWKGDIFKVEKTSFDGVDVEPYGEGKCTYILNSEYVVLENYKPYKITLSEFLKRKEKLAIHCDTEDKAKELLKAFDRMGKKWLDGTAYYRETNYMYYREETCYTNIGQFSPRDWYQRNGYKIFDFAEVDLEN